MDFHSIDHFLFGGSDLKQASSAISSLFDIQLVKGGAHPGKGTRNELLGLSHGAYLEVIGPDPAQLVDLVWMNLDKAEAPRLFRWAAKCNDLKRLREKALNAGIDLGEIQPGSRQQADGTLLQWQLTNPDLVLCDGLIPFFIDWGPTGNPSARLPLAGEITKFYGVHPAPEKVRSILNVLEIEMPIIHGDAPGLVVEIGKNERTIQLT